MGAKEAVDLTARLNDIGFPEFTAKLITDVFDAIISANIRQTEAYVELVNSVGKSLTQFINDTEDSIGGDLILQFLATIVPDENNPENGTKITDDNNGTLTTDEASKVNDAVKIVGVQETPVADDSTPINNLYGPIIEAVAKRIAADKYTILKEMVKLGILRIVVEEGEIETKLVFTTFGSEFYRSNRSRYNRNSFVASARARTGGFLSGWVSASASTRYTNLNVSTSSAETRDTTGSSVQIYGGVKIRFKTDYQPLLQENQEEGSVQTS